MQQSERIADYLEKAIPKTVSAKKYDKIRDELLSHILDKADFYIEIGYGKDEAYEKALEEMGEPEQVSTQFEKVYSEKKIFCRLVFAAIIFADLFATLTGFGTSIISVFLGNDLYLSYDSLLISSLFFCSVTVAILYAYKQKHPSMLRNIGFAHLLLSVPLFSGSIYYPVCLRLLDFLPIEVEIFLKDWLFLFVPLIPFSLFIICMTLASERKMTKRKATVKGKTAGLLTAVLLSLCLLWCSNLTVGDNSPSLDEFLLKDAIVMIKNSVTSRSRIEKLYLSINRDTTVAEADIILREAGYIPVDELAHLIAEDDLEELLGYIGVDAQKDRVYFKNDENINVLNEAGLIIPGCENETFGYKKIYYGAQIRRTDILFHIEHILFNRDSTKMARESFEKFSIGDNKNDVLKRISRMCNEETAMTEYTVNGEIETYTFETGEVRWAIDDIYYSFHCTISFRDNKLVSGNYVYYRQNQFDAENVYEEYREYVIEK